MEKQGRSGILFRCFKEHTTLKSTFQITASPGRGKLSPQVTDEGAGSRHFALNTPHPALRATFPQGVKALAPDQAPKIDFHEHTKIGLDIFLRTCYTIPCKCGHRTSASISAFQAEEVGSIPIARSTYFKRSIVRYYAFCLPFDPVFDPVFIFTAHKALCFDPKKKGRNPARCRGPARKIKF